MYGRSTELFDRLSTDFMCLVSQKLLCYNRNKPLPLLAHLHHLSRSCLYTEYYVE